MNRDTNEHHIWAKRNENSWYGNLLRENVYKKRKDKQHRVKKPLRLRIFFSISAFAVLIASGLLSSAGITILNQSGAMDHIGNQTYASMMLSMAISVLIGTILTMAWGQFILEPLCDLMEVLDRIKEGNYDVNLKKGKFKRLLIGKEFEELKDSVNQMAKELNSTELFRKDFISSFSHEFKTPIISICGFAEQIYQGNLTEQEQKEFAKIIMDESNRLALLSTNILTLTKLENQDIVSNRTNFGLDEQIRDALLLFEDTWSKKNITIDMDLERVMYYQNQEMLFIIWKNLFSNAVKYTPENGSIVVTCRQIEGDVVVSVKDSGIGMDEETKHHVFDKFYQVDTSHAMEGNGLGLAIVKQVLVLVKGKIEIESMPGAGAEFIVTLPSATGVYL